MSFKCAILCSHNGARFIAAQIDSILGQNVGIDAIHVHDFGSSDTTLAIAEASAASNPGRVHVTAHAEAPGAAASFMKALRLTLPLLPPDALVFFVDQDDVWLPHKTQALERELRSSEISLNDSVLIFHDVRVVDAELRVIRPTYYSGNPFRLPRDLNPASILMSNPAIGHTMVLSAPLARQVANWPDATCYLMHDWLALLVASRMGTIHFVDEALSLYRQHEANVLGAYRTDRRPARIAKLMRFADGLIRQAICFSRSMDVVGHRSIESRPAMQLESACRQGYRAAAAALAVAAFHHGPTWQRKAIGLILLVRAVFGRLRNAN